MCSFSFHGRARKPLNARRIQSTARFPAIDAPMKTDDTRSTFEEAVERQYSYVFRSAKYRQNCVSPAHIFAIGILITVSQDEKDSIMTPYEKK